MQTKVAIYKCSEYDCERVEQGVESIFAHFGGIEQFVKPGQRVLIKPNLLAPDPSDKLTCTHPLVIEAVIKLVQRAGGIAFVGDNPTIGSVHKAVRVSGLGDVCKEYGVKVIGFGRQVKHETAIDEKYGALYVTETIHKFDVILNVAKLKAHGQLLLTLGVKNMFGVVKLASRVRKHFISNGDVAAFARMLIKIYQITQPAFTLVDGIIAMERTGPRGGDPKNVGLLFGGENAIAVDRVIVEALGLPYEDLPTLKAAGELGLAGCDLSKIKLCGEAIEAVKVTDFRFPELTSISFEIYRSVKILAREVYNGIKDRLGIKKQKS